MTSKRNQCAAACWAQNVAGCFTRCKAQVMDGTYINEMEEEAPHKFCKTHNKVIDSIVSRAHFGHFFVHQKWEINGEFGKEWDCRPCIKCPLKNGNKRNGEWQLCNEYISITQLFDELPKDFRPWINVLGEAITDEEKYLETNNKKVVKVFMKRWREERLALLPVPVVQVPVVPEPEVPAPEVPEPEVPELPPPSPPIIGEAIAAPQEVEGQIIEPLQAEAVEPPPPPAPKKARRKLKIVKKKPVVNPEENC